MKTQAPIRAVVVEDEPMARQTIKDFLKGEDWLELIGEAGDGDRAVGLMVLSRLGSKRRDARVRRYNVTQDTLSGLLSEATSEGAICPRPSAEPVINILAIE